MKRAYFLVLILSIVLTGYSQKKTSEDKIKGISGTAVGGANLSPEQVKQKAIDDAKVNALREAGISENINSYTDYFRSESEDKFEELFTKDILSNINGTVKDIEVIEEKAKSGIKKILVFPLSFVADCLETNLEIATEYAELFKKHGGEHFQMVESLNAEDFWVNSLKTIILAE